MAFFFFGEGASYEDCFFNQTPEEFVGKELYALISGVGVGDEEGEEEQEDKLKEENWSYGFSFFTQTPEEFLGKELYRLGINGVADEGEEKQEAKGDCGGTVDEQDQENNESVENDDVFSENENDDFDKDQEEEEEGEEREEEEEANEVHKQFLLWVHRRQVSGGILECC
uniref:Uncharacterized protein n=1 Tax=Nelumbo nucifera TaxID=4432 RepID=A0A822ZW79_NELNU|nr:TPA_asm: hypothetical protein HUJ06_017456 [Nelumbo nucifera]